MLPLCAAYLETLSLHHTEGIFMHVQEVATKADERPDYPRSGHCSTALPAGCPHGDVLIFGG